MRVKMSKQPPPAPTASAVGPCPTVIQIVGRPGTGSLTSTIAPPDLDIIEAEKKIMKCTYMVKHTSSIPLVLLYINFLYLWWLIYAISSFAKRLNGTDQPLYILNWQQIGFKISHK